MTNAEKAERYINDVMTGREVCCRWTRLAVERHVADLEKSKSDEFRYRYDPTRGERPCRVIELLPHTKGKWAQKNETLVMEPWQAFILCCVFGWVDKVSGNRRFREAMIVVSRKNGKSAMSAGAGLYMLGYDNEHGAEVYCIATTENQAWEVFKPAKIMAGTPGLKSAKGIEVNAKAIVIQSTASVFRPLIGDPPDGSSPSFAIIDELHEHQTSAAMDTMVTGMGARDQPLLWIITTAGDNLAGPCYAKQLGLQDILAGSVTDDTVFGIVYTIDTAPYAQTVRDVVALEEMDRLCSRKCVSTTQIEEQWQKVCATLAGSKITAKATSALSALTALDGKRSAGVYARHATTGSEQPAGRKTAGPQPKDTKGNTRSAFTNTASPRNNTPSSLQTKAESANSAESSQTTPYVSIMTTAQAIFGAYSADNATRASAFSEMTKQVWNAHSPTCEARKCCQPTSDGLVVQREPDDWTDPACLKKANPNMGVSVNEEYLLNLQQQAIRTPREQGRFKTKNLNLWVNSRAAYFNMESWARCKPAPDINTLAGRPCRIALDLASTNDIAALEMLFDISDLTGEEGSYARYGRSYLPEATVEDPANGHYQQWRDQGLITVTDGNIIDFRQIEEDIKDYCKIFNVLDVCYDPFQATYLTTRLLDSRINMVEYKPTVETMSDAMKTLDSWVNAGKLYHNCGPDHPMTWQMSNVTGKLDAKDNVYPRKERPEKKIDNPVAAIMCVGRALADPAPRGSVYETRGLLIF